MITDRAACDTTTSKMAAVRGSDAASDRNCPDFRKVFMASVTERLKLRDLRHGKGDKKQQRAERHAAA